MRTQASLLTHVIALALIGLTWSCSQEPRPSAPPAPIPAPPAMPAPAQPAPIEPTLAPAPEPSVAPDAPKPSPKPVAPEPVAPKRAAAKPAAPQPVAEPETAKPIAQPVAPEPSPKPEPKTAVRVPQSAHVRTDVPKALQALLDADTRMQTWLDRTYEIIERCHADERAKNAQAIGTIVLSITMHENSRPDADVKTLPPQLSGVVACATGKLMRAPRMPLFTGPEGATHAARVTFSR